LASENAQVEVLHKLREWGKEIVTTEEFNNMLFLAKDRYGRTPGTWHQRKSK